ncbi:MAG: elongation factor G [Bacteroidales bacterium]|nr:elongation factor G [Bacteroidales bacterium]MCB8999724.1 elongation factor G [Bacteroidales bacterium]MCB9013116.1 elongation factor G [Bacteroidales bacterium]
MKTYLTNQIKNIVLLGNAGSGKTTLAESMLFEGGIIDRRGDIASKNTVSDFNLIEHENESSIFSTVLYTEYNDKKINFIDVPGSDDFVGGTISGLHIADSALLLINAQNGIEVGTEIHNRWVEKFQKPLIIAINHLDHDKANYEKSLEMLNERFRGKIAGIQYPVNAGPGFNSIIDLIKMKLLKYPADGGKPEILDIPADELDRATELKAELIEKAAENDENLMELFFEKETLTEDEMRKGISVGLLNRGMYPVFCVSGKKNIGVGRLMEFISNVAPSPDQLPAPKDKSGNEIKCDPKGPAALFVFKTTIEPHIGEVNYFKVMSGEISEGMDLVNARSSKQERLSQIFAAAGKHREKLSKMVAGDIGSTVKLKSTKTGDTLGASSNINFPHTPYPEPKYRTAIRPLNESDDEKLGEALNRIHEEDPTLLIEYSKELKQIILSGQGEYHLNIVKWHLDNIYKIDTEYLTPKIPYRETITKSAQADYRHKKQSGGSGQFGEVHMLIEPFIEGAKEPETFKANGKEMKLSLRGKEEHELPWGGKLVYYNCIVGGSIDARFMPAILKGIMEKMETGPLTGSYARDIRVFVYDGKMHPVDSNEISFRLAGRNAFSQAFKNAGPKILEPIYLVEVLVPGDRMGDVMSDLQGRRAIVQGMSSEKGFEKITAKVPLAEMNKYSTSLSSITSGRAIYSMKYSEYAQVPGDVQEALLKAYEEEADEE